MAYIIDPENNDYLTTNTAHISEQCSPTDKPVIAQPSD